MRGSEYEQFAYEKFRQLFPNATVTRNDYIHGSLSDLDREIDVSIKITVESQQLLYIVQCKDWKKPVDIKVLGEFSAVIKDVQASKVFCFVLLVSLEAIISMHLHLGLNWSR